jgi:voltage-gated potassium channel
LGVGHGGWDSHFIYDIGPLVKCRFRPAEDCRNIRAMSGPQEPRAGWRERLRLIIFEAETSAGRQFDLLLLLLISLSVAAVMLESVASVRERYGLLLNIAEWVFTVFFTIEYVIRLLVVTRPSRYARSFFGVVDLLSILPSYLELLIPGSQTLLVIRILRLLRIFRVLKMVRHVNGAELLMRALYASRAKITVFFFSVLVLTVIAGTVMYLIEGERSGFSSIPVGVYWAIVTITTVGFGDITPQTPAGQVVASVCMLLGYAIIAVPTGIVTAEVIRQDGDETTDACPGCGVHGHLPDAEYCRRCGEKL